MKDNTEIMNASNSVYSLNNISDSIEGYYYCKINNECGSVVTDTVYLIIKNQNGLQRIYSSLKICQKLNCKEISFYYLVIDNNNIEKLILK